MDAAPPDGDLDGHEAHGQTRSLGAVRACVLAVALAATTADAAGAAPEPVVRTAGGAVRGETVAGTDRFRDIPYAAPPAFGAFHTAELQYLFDLPTTPVPAEQGELSTSMQRYWATFAAKGDPNVRSEVRWPAFDAGRQRMLSLQTPDATVVTGFATDHHCGFWAGRD
jgi:carboxylesterase type B